MYKKISDIGKGALAMTLIGLMLASIAIASPIAMYAGEADAAPTCQNLAITGVTASGYETGNPPTNAVDNNLSTRWSNYGVGSWIKADLGKQQIVCSVDIAWYKGNSRTNSFVIAVSSDGTSYTNVYSGTSSGTTTSAERYSFAETSARYVRVTVTDTSSSSWMSINEMYVNGYTPIDTVAPTVSITSPLAGATLLQQNGKILVQGTASDDVKVQIVELRIDNGSYATATPKAPGDWSTWTISIDVGSSGTYRLVPRATDTSGNQAWNSISITVVADAIAPSVSVTSVLSGSTVPTGTLLVAGTASDNSGGSGINNVQVRLDSGVYVTATPKAIGDWSTWSTSLNIASTGAHTIYAKATDKVGNTNEVTSSITASTLSTTTPLVAITQPSANAALNSGTISVTGTSSDAAGVKTVEVSIDGGAYSSATSTGTGWSTWAATLTTTAGSHTIRARATDNSGNQATSSVTVSVTISALDKFGIKKLYPTKSGGNEWFVNMDSPTSDPMFRNLPSMTKQSDGSWQVSATQVRMEAWSPTNQKWQNVEITEYAKIIGGTNQLLQMYTRGGHHTTSDPCQGSAVKARLYGDGHATWVKEVNHPAYTGNRGSVQVTNTPLLDRWVGFKAVVYNVVGSDGKTYVRLESYIDDSVTDANGNLVIKNNWKLASVVEDHGGWSTSDPDFVSTCSPLNVDSTQQYRQRDEILSKPGGTSTANLGAFRSDDLTWDWKYLSVREISAPTS